MQPEHSGDAVDARPKTDCAAGSFLIVGIGPSAGGLAAFEAFFSGMPADADPGMAFLNGTLQLLEPAAPRGRRLPIDFFFRSMPSASRPAHHDEKTMVSTANVD